MRLEDLVTRIPSDWREDFEKFIQTGEANEEFLNFLDQDPTCQAVVEKAFAAQATAFEKFAKYLSQPHTSDVHPERTEYTEELSNELARTVSAVAELPSEVQQMVAERAAVLCEFRQSKRTNSPLGIFWLLKDKCV